MALWTITQETTYLWKTGPEAQVTSVVRVVDDAMEPVLDSTVALFGRDEIYTVQTADGEILAKIQYSAEQKAGWVRDREAPGDYVVQFRARREAAV